MAAPLGNQNAVKAKRWQQAIDRALENRSRAKGIEELDRLAEAYLSAAEEMAQSTLTTRPSIAGFADLADRLDGRPAQSITGADGGPLITAINVTLIKPE